MDKDTDPAEHGEEKSGHCPLFDASCELKMSVHACAHSQTKGSLGCSA